MEFNNTPNKAVWISRSVAVQFFLVLVYRNKKYILASKRGIGTPDPEFVGAWNVVTGYLDWDETVQGAVIRETFEETGLNVLELIKQSKLIQDYFSCPWYVRSIPEGRQNVSLGFGMVLKYPDNLPLPRLTAEHSEQDEVETPTWIRTTKVQQLEWAFNHNERIQDFLNLLN